MISVLSPCTGGILRSPNPSFHVEVIEYSSNQVVWTAQVACYYSSKTKIITPVSQNASNAPLHPFYTSGNLHAVPSYSAAFFQMMKLVPETDWSEVVVRLTSRLL